MKPIAGTNLKVLAKGSPYRVQVLDRALGILDVLAGDSSELGLIDLSERVHLHKSTVHRLLMVLERHRLVEKRHQNGKYRLGLRLFELGSKAVANLNLHDRARPYLERLVLETGETAHLCIFGDGEMLSLANVESPRTLRTPSTVGRRIPTHCTAVGKAFIAFLPKNKLEGLVKKHGLRAHTRNTITSFVRLRTELQRVREQGYAVDNGEIEDGLKCIAAPIRNYSGEVIASLGIAGPAFRLIEDKVGELAHFVTKAAKELSAELGYFDGPAGKDQKA